MLPVGMLDVFVNVIKLLWQTLFLMYWTAANETDTVPLLNTVWFFISLVDCKTLLIKRSKKQPTTPFSLANFTAVFNWHMIS